MKRVVLVAVLAGVVLATLWIIKAPTSRPSSYDFRLETWDHQRFYLHEHRGKAVVLMFWDTQCVICKQEMAWLRNIHAQNTNNLTIAAICTDPKNSDTLSHIVEILALPYPILLDPGAVLAQRYGVRVYPTTVILDQAGQQAAVITGYSEIIQRQLTQRIERLLK
jgi:peroxiredoxin